eukprot:TRINITY_DN13134_c0_g1_i1.p1 TRINITY_DN13134_c0_g1~~TRINITY_DN13134_c0_g1_i1.p1  ORF type:complete len:665 (+),score=119.21 TRINITY_DN13134_c0_g1_i1:153-1997(+)
MLRVNSFDDYDNASTPVLEISCDDDTYYDEHPASNRACSRLRCAAQPDEGAGVALRRLLEGQLREAAEELVRHHRRAAEAVDQYFAKCEMQHCSVGIRSNDQSMFSARDQAVVRMEENTLMGDEISKPGRAKMGSKVNAFTGRTPRDAAFATQKSTGGAKRAKAAKAKQASKHAKNAGESDKGPARAVFADAAAMKEQVKSATMKPVYSVTDYYHESGLFQQIATSTIFDNLTLLVISINALWIAVEIDLNTEAMLFDAHPVFIVIENAFCVYFLVEICVRFFAFRSKMYCLRDAWFVFDACLVLMMVLETWVVNIILYTVGAGSTAVGDASIMRTLRLFRLTRMARMVRLLRSMPELMILIKGISVASRSVIFTLVLLLIIIYLFAIAFVQITASTPLQDAYFRSVPEAMVTLLLRGTLPDMADLVENVGDVSYLVAGVLLVFILLSSLTVLNMLVGVLCEVVGAVSSVEREQMTLQFVKYKLLELLKKGDQDGSLSITREEFESILVLPEGAKIIQEVGVDAVGLVDFVDHIFVDDVEISFQEFMEIMLQLRGSNAATVKDIVDLRKAMIQLMETTFEGMVDSFNDVVVREVTKHIDDALKPGTFYSTFQDC